MANLLPLPNAISKARQAAERYDAACLKLQRALCAPKSHDVRCTPEAREKLERGLADAYSKLSSAQWELEQVLK